jgi:hypothetical protein
VHASILVGAEASLLPRCKVLQVREYATLLGEPAPLIVAGEEANAKRSHGVRRNAAELEAEREVLRIGG